jgi:hypothetical protein
VPVTPNKAFIGRPTQAQKLAGLLAASHSFSSGLALEARKLQET